MAVYEIPLSAEAQTLSITLAGVTYQLTLKWNAASACWVLDIADASQNPIVSGIPLVPGCDLLEQYGYLNFGGQLVAQTDNDITEPPDYTELGTFGHLYFVTP